MIHLTNLEKYIDDLSQNDNRKIRKKCSTEKLLEKLKTKPELDGNDLQKILNFLLQFRFSIAILIMVLFQKNIFGATLSNHKLNIIEKLWKNLNNITLHHIH